MIKLSVLDQSPIAPGETAVAKRGIRRMGEDALPPGTPELFFPAKKGKSSAVREYK